MASQNDRHLLDFRFNERKTPSNKTNFQKQTRRRHKEMMTTERNETKQKEEKDSEMIRVCIC